MIADKGIYLFAGSAVLVKWIWNKVYCMYQNVHTLILSAQTIQMEIQQK